MQNHYQLSDQAFEAQFQNCTLSPSLFNHEAHLRLAWIHITKYGEATAITNICSQLISYVSFLGAKEKYNTTLTVAAIKAVNHFVNKSNSDTFKSFIKEFPRLKNNFKELMSAHYGFDIFDNVRAKKEFLEPDLLPFD